MRIIFVDVSEKVCQTREQMAWRNYVLFLFATGTEFIQRQELRKGRQVDLDVIREVLEPLCELAKGEGKGWKLRGAPDLDFISAYRPILNLKRESHFCLFFFLLDTLSCVK